MKLMKTGTSLLERIGCVLLLLVVGGALASNTSSPTSHLERPGLRICASFFENHTLESDQNALAKNPLSDAQVSCFDQRSSQMHVMTPMTSNATAATSKHTHHEEVEEEATSNGCTTVFYVPNDACLGTEDYPECHSMEETTFSWWEPFMNQFVGTNHLQCIIEKPGMHPTKVLAKKQTSSSSSPSAFPHFIHNHKSPSITSISVQLFPDRRCDFHNGCGAEYWPPAMRTLLDAATGFQDECNYHDCCYHECSETRASCDDQFGILMEQQCRNAWQHHDEDANSKHSSSLWNQFRQWTCSSLARVMHKAVKVLGQPAYDEAQRQSQCPGME